MMIRKLYMPLAWMLLAMPAVAQNSAKISYEKYIEQYKDLAIREMKLYGIPASITMAQAVLESGAGNSRLAVKANNHFGIKCHNDWDGHTFYQDDDTHNECFRKYDDPERSFKDHSVFLSTRERYAFLFDLDVTDYKGWAQGLRDAGYATNPRYPALLVDLIERYQLQQYDLTEAELLAYHSKKSEKPEPETGTTGKGLPEIAKHARFVVVGGEPPIFDVNSHRVDMNGPRKVYIKNNVRCVIAHKDDSFMKIAEDLDMVAWQIYKYNDLGKTDRVQEGQLIYIKPKKSQFRREGYHKVQQGETLYSISQQYGVKLKSLVRLNEIDPAEGLFVGQKIRLNKDSEI